MRPVGFKNTFTHVCLELDKLQPSAVELQYVLHLGWVCSFVRGRRGLDVCRVFTLRHQSVSRPSPQAGE